MNTMSSKIIGHRTGWKTRVLIAGVGAAAAGMLTMSGTALAASSTSSATPPAPGSGNLTTNVSMSQLSLTALQNSITIEQQVLAEAQVQQMQRWQVVQNVQANIFSVQQQVTQSRAQAGNQASIRWDQFIR